MSTPTTDPGPTEPSRPDEPSASTATGASDTSTPTAERTGGRAGVAAGGTSSRPTVDDRPVAIDVDDVSKKYRKYREKASSLKERILRRGTKRYEDHWAVKDVSLQIREGAFYGLIGHNGSGKSSLLRLMSGIQTPTTGSVRTTGRISALLELGAGFHPDLSGRENIYMNASIFGLRRKEVDAIIDDIIDFSQIEEISPGAIDSAVKHYSSGMYVRLGFAVAVFVDPQILLVDEVIAVGDEEFQRRCIDHLSSLRNNGVTIVIVTHALGLVKNSCDGAAWLDHGVLQLEGAAPEVVDGYIERVNAAEEARLEAEAESGANPGAPGGSGPKGHVVVEGVELLDRNGRSVVTAQTGEPLTVRVHWAASTATRAPIFTLGVSSDVGHHVGVAPMRPGDQPHTLSGSGHVDYEMPRLVLAPGTFHFGVDIHDAHGMVRLDHQEQAATLHVQPGKDYILGLADLQGRWDEVREDGS